MLYAAYFIAGLGIGALLWSLSLLVDWESWLKPKYRHKSMLKYMARVNLAELQHPVPTPQTLPREISELTYRDIDNKLRTVKIVVDPNITDASPEVAMAKMGNSPDTDPEEFVFTAEAIATLKSQGLEVDEFVRNMLRQAGKIA